MKSMAAFLLVFSSFGFAYECPKYNLKCDLQKVNDKGAFETVKSILSPFEAFNWQEPSEEPNTCEANVYFGEADTGLGVSYHVTVNEDLQASLFASAQDPQFVVEAVPGKAFTLYYKTQQVVCVLK
jgi:hypothetical protein